MQTIYVAPDGNDQWDGSCPKPQKQAHGPLATLSRARDLARALRTHAPEQPITLQLACGHYCIDGSIVFSEQDSGTREAPLIIRGDHERPTRLMGGRAINTFRKVTDEEASSLGFHRDCRDAIRVCDLASPGSAVATPCGEATCAPTEPDVQDYRIRFLKGWFCYV